MYLIHGGFLDGDVDDTSKVVEDFVEGFLGHIFVDLRGDEAHIHGVDHGLLGCLLRLGVVDGPADSVKEDVKMTW